MPHSSFKILPGVDTTKTPALNEAAISQSQLIRFVPDRTLGGIVQKLGGWSKYVQTSLGSICRALWAWEDTNSNSYLVAGCEGRPAGAGGSLQVIENGNATDISPQEVVFNLAPDFSTTSGSNVVTITLTGATVTSLDSIFLETQISIGGLVLFGLYPCTSSGVADTFIIYATDLLGNPAKATSTASHTGTLPYFTTSPGSATITVTFPNHGYYVGNTFPVLRATTVDNITLYGNYLITSVSNPNTFSIAVSNISASIVPVSAYLNSNLAYILQYHGISPTGIVKGYGEGPYGIGGYGTGVTSGGPIPGAYINAVDWTLDNWGQILVANPLGSGIFIWDPTSGNQNATIIGEAPPVNNGMFIAMPQRQIVAWGSTNTGFADPLLIRWCDINNFNDWIDKLTNQAGSFRIPKGSRIVQCIQGPQQALVWTDLGLWTMQYTGPPYVYAINELANGCGLIGRKAAGSMNGVVYWMGQSQFYKLAGGGPEPIRCPVWDVVFQELDQVDKDKIRFAANSRFGEVGWYFPTSPSGDVTTYVKYNIYLDQWDYGTLTRTAWINESVLGPPIGAGSDYYLYQHETGYNADTQAMNSYFQTGYFVLTEAEFKMFVDQIWPDMKWGYYGNSNQAANVLFTFYVTDYPSQTPSVYGPFTMTQASTYITPRFRGRLVSIKVESNDIDSFWRLGNIRYRVSQDGKY